MCAPVPRAPLSGASLPAIIYLGMYVQVQLPLSFTSTEKLYMYIVPRLRPREVLDRIKTPPGKENTHEEDPYPPNMPLKEGRRGEKGKGSNYLCLEGKGRPGGTTCVPIRKVLGCGETHVNAKGRGRGEIETIGRYASPLRGWKVGETLHRGICLEGLTGRGIMPQRARGFIIIIFLDFFLMSNVIYPLNT